MKKLYVLVKFFGDQDREQSCDAWASYDKEKIDADADLLNRYAKNWEKADKKLNKARTKEELDELRELLNQNNYFAKLIDPKFEDHGIPRYTVEDLELR